ncbi:MAG: hypothetical protein ACRC2R_23965 [Xenococcaceae cyanobacterium]
MNSSILRELWTLIEDIQPHVLIQLNEQELIEKIIKQLENKKSLDRSENDRVSNYISSKICLIRDLAESRLEFA